MKTGGFYPFMTGIGGRLSRSDRHPDRRRRAQPPIRWLLPGALSVV